MKIDLGTILTGISFLLVCSVPFILLSRSNRKREKQILQRLNGVAQKNNGTVSKYNTWGNTAIGIDGAANIVFFTKKTGEVEMAEQIMLAETEKCRVVNTKRTERNEDGNYTLTDKLELLFEPKDKKKKATALPFYHMAYDGAILTGELQQSEKWCSIINDNIAAIAQKKQ
ncbi:MAG: hypothetical protein ABI685_04875 [Ferruginibacter sp.]